MKLYSIDDVLSVTTGRLVSDRHMDGIYDILNFLTSDNLFTHQLPRALNECEPWLRSQFPMLMSDSPGMPERLADLDRGLKAGQKRGRKAIIRNWVEGVRLALKLPVMLPVYELGSEMHTHIDPVEESRAMVGDDRVVVAEGSDKEVMTTVSIGIGKFRAMNGSALRALRDVLLVEDFGKPVAVVIPYARYLEMQELIMRAYRMLPDLGLEFETAKALMRVKERYGDQKPG